MKRRCLVSILSTVLLLTISACGSKQEVAEASPTLEPTNIATATPVPQETKTPEPTKEPTPLPEVSEEPVIEWTPEGDYILAYVGDGESYFTAGEMGFEGSMTLAEKGKGNFAFEGEEMSIKNWEVHDSDFSITLEDDGTAHGSYKDGVIELDVTGDGTVIMVFAQENADPTIFTNQ